MFVWIASPAIFMGIFRRMMDDGLADGFDLKSSRKETKCAASSNCARDFNDRQTSRRVNSFISKSGRSVCASVNLKMFS